MLSIVLLAAKLADKCLLIQPRSRTFSLMHANHPVGGLSGPPLYDYDSPLLGIPRHQILPLALRALYYGLLVFSCCLPLRSVDYFFLCRHFSSSRTKLKHDFDVIHSKTTFNDTAYCFCLFLAVFKRNRMDKYRGRVSNIYPCTFLCNKSTIRFAALNKRRSCMSVRYTNGITYLYSQNGAPLFNERIGYFGL